MKRNGDIFPPSPERRQPTGGVIDATGQVLGRVARDISVALQGKDKPTYTPHTPVGDYVVVVNAARVRVTGRKLLQKMYYRHSGYVGNLKSFRLRDVLESHPERVISLAVKGMLPRNHQGRQMLRETESVRGG